MEIQNEEKLAKRNETIEKHLTLLITSFSFLPSCFSRLASIHPSARQGRRLLSTVDTLRKSNRTRLGTLAEVGRVSLLLYKGRRGQSHQQHVLLGHCWLLLRRLLLAAAGRQHHHHGAAGHSHQHESHVTALSKPKTISKRNFGHSR